MITARGSQYLRLRRKPAPLSPISIFPSL